jgi:outer membrane protein assembly factor BamE (lipoprotein component of BamABCDE complex)
MFYKIEAIMKKLSIAVCIFLCSLFAGCVVVPVPTGKHTPQVFNTRGEIDAAALGFMHPGSTDKEEVLLQLGEPDGIWQDERYFLYRWVSVTGGYLICVAADPYGGGSGGLIAPLKRKRYDLLIEFDDKGVVKRIGDIDTWATKIEGQKDAPLDLSTPIRIAVTHQRRLARDKIASLILGKNFFELRGRDSKPSHSFKILPEKNSQDFY